MDAASTRRVNFLHRGDSVLDGLRMGEVGVWRWKIDSDDLQWTDNLEHVHDLPPGSFDGTLSSFQRDIHPEDASAVWQSIRASLESGKPYKAVYRTAPGDNKLPRWLEARGGVVSAPDGAKYLTGVCLDVTERVRNEIEIRRRLRQQQAIERFGSIVLIEDDFEKMLQRAVDTAADVLDVPLAKILQFANAADHLVLKAGVGWNDGLVGTATVGIGKESQAGFTLLSERPVVVHDLPAETRFSGPQLLHDHGVRSGLSVIIPGSENRPFGVFGVHTRTLRSFDQADIDFLVSMANIVANGARQHAAAEQRGLVLREMAHRAGNMLQLVNAIANQTFTEGKAEAAAMFSFSERLGSLSRANHVVSRGGWTSTRFVALLEEALQAFRGRMTLEGRDILLPPELCFDLGLVLHELATNSVKYGTLGLEYGQIAIRWAMSPAREGTRHFNFVWDDPKAAPKAAISGGGFGSKLISALIERKWDGRISIETDPGYRFSFEIPIPVASLDSKSSSFANFS